MPPFQFELDESSWGSIYLNFNDCYGREVEISLLIPGTYGGTVESWHANRIAFCNSFHPEPFKIDITNSKSTPEIYHLLGAYKNLRGRETNLWHPFPEYTRTEISPPLIFKISGSGNTPGAFYQEKITAHARVEIAEKIICGTSAPLTELLERILKGLLHSEGNRKVEALEDLRRRVLDAERNKTETDLIIELRKYLRD